MERMPRCFWRFAQYTPLVYVLAGFIFCSVSFAAPTVSGISGTASHGQVLVLSGSGFGNKTTAAPVVWDDCSGTNILEKWSGGWPTSPISDNYVINYRAPMRGVQPAHSFAAKYLCGAAAGTGSGYPNNIMIWKNRTITSYPAYSYISFYTRVDPLYNSGDNFKWFDYSTRNSPYTMNSSTDSNWYLEYVGGLGNSHHINDDGGSIYNVGPDWTVDLLGNSKYFGSSINPKTQWVKIELEIKYTNANDGWINIFENGKLIKSGSAPHSYNGPTDKYTSTTSRNEAIGGFTRNIDPNNWRYFNDLYLDWTLARVVIGNASSYSACTVREVQPPTDWSTGKISLVFNQGRLANSSQAWVYVIDSTGAVNSSGFPVTIGASTPTGAPSVVENLRTIGN